MKGRRPRAGPFSTMIAFLGNAGASRRLHRIGGRWVLEHQVFMPLGQGVFRPTLQKVQGESAILQSVQEAEALRQMTARLMQEYAAADVGDVSFESVNGGAWRPYTPPQEEDEQDPKAAGKPDDEGTSPEMGGSSRRQAAQQPEEQDVSSEPLSAAAVAEVAVLKEQLAALAGKVEKAATHAELTSLRDSVTEIVSGRDSSSALEAPVLAELEELREKLNANLEKLKDVATQPEVGELKDILCEVAERQERFAKQIRDLQERLDAVAGPPPGSEAGSELSAEESEAMNAIASALGGGGSLLGQDS
jgi:hypothetical protein